MPEWLQSPVAVFGLAIGAMFFGYFFGLFEGRGQGYKRRKTEEVEKEENKSASEPLPQANPPAPFGEVPMLAVSEDSTGQLRLILDGQRINAATMDAEQRKRIITVLTQMRPWLDSPKSAPLPSRPQPVSSPQGEETPKGVPEPTPRLSQKPTPAPKPAVPQSTKDKKEPIPEPQSIVEQVDSILQVQMVGTPLIGKGIRLQESPEGGVIVWVGINKFEGVDEVPDEEIKAAIRAAISVWENKFTPGL